PPEPGLQDFRVPGSPVDLFDGLCRSPCRSPGMDCDVASLADYQRLAFHGGHREHPARPLRSPFHVEVCELPDVVGLDLLSGAAEFARIREEPGYQLGSWGWRAILVREAIFDVHERICRQPDASETGNQRLFAVPFQFHLKAPSHTALMIDLGPEASGHLPDGRFVPVCEGLE